MSRGAERGVVLLEVLIALAVLGAAGIASVGMLIQAADALSFAETAERRMDDESRLLTAITLLTREDLERRLGRRSAGGYDIEIARASATLYRISVGGRSEGGAADLVTLVARPEPIR